MMPVTIATIIAVSTDAMILFCSNDGIDALSRSRRSGRQPTATVRRRRKSDSSGQLNRIVRANYAASDLPTKRACCRSLCARIVPHVPFRPAPTPDHPDPDPARRRPAAAKAARGHRRVADDPACLAPSGRRRPRPGRRRVERPRARRHRGARGRAVLTEPDLPTGSDRIHAAITALDPERHHDAVVNVQGDMPMLDPAAIRLALEALADPETDIATLAAAITDPAALTDTSVNKVVAGFADPARPARALYFSKAVVPWGEGPHYEHIGLYAYRRVALERFVTLPRGVLEQRERLEQLRALEAGMRFSVSLIDKARLGVQVDTPADLERARELMSAK